MIKARTFIFILLMAFLADNVSGVTVYLNGRVTNSGK